MKTLYIVCATGAVLLLSGCNGPQTKDYDSAATCQAQGLQPGTGDYDKCVNAEQSARAMEEQRKEYEDTKWQQEYWRNQRSGF